MDGTTSLRAMSSCIPFFSNSHLTSWYKLLWHCLQVHEAIMREDSENYPEGVVTQEFRRGFKIGYRLLRPAMVKVSAGPPANSAPVPPQPAEEVEKAEDASEEQAE